MALKLQCFGNKVKIIRIKSYSSNTVVVIVRKISLWFSRGLTKNMKTICCFRMNSQSNKNVPINLNSPDLK